MTKDNIWEGFVKLFPTYVEKVETFQKIGSKTIKLNLHAKEGEPHKYLIFMYNDPWDWTFGTKVWRSKPRKYKADFSAVTKKEDTNNESDAENK